MADFPSFALGRVLCIAALVLSRALAAGFAGIGVTLLRRTAARSA